MGAELQQRKVAWILGYLWNGGDVQSECLSHFYDSSLDFLMEFGKTFPGKKSPSGEIIVNVVNRLRRVLSALVDDGWMYVTRVGSVDANYYQEGKWVGIYHLADWVIEDMGKGITPEAMAHKWGGYEMRPKGSFPPDLP